MVHVRYIHQFTLVQHNMFAIVTFFLNSPFLWVFSWSNLSSPELRAAYEKRQYKGISYSDKVNSFKIKFDIACLHVYLII